MRNTFEIMAGNPNGNKPFLKLRCRWKDNVVACLQETAIVKPAEIALARERSRKFSRC
jgi:hypothetical protein